MKNTKMSDYDDSFEESEDDCGLLKQALHVEFPENFNPDKVPQTGEEYLHHVIYERRKYKSWTTADIDLSKFENKQTLKLEMEAPINQALPSLLPSKHWQTEKIEEFTNFQKFIRFKITKVSTVSSFHEDTFLERVNSEEPKFSEVVTYTQAAKIRMFQIISRFVDTIPKGESISKTMGAWIYAILTLLEKPLSPDSCHTLRSFAKKCLVLRSNLDKDSTEDLYKPLNLFICIIARFYNQLDLADP